MLSAATIGLALLSVPSLNNPKGKGSDSNGSHRIKCSVWRQGQGCEIGKISSNKICKARSYFPGGDAWNGKQKEIELGLQITDTVQDDTSAKNRIPEPWKILTNTDPLQAESTQLVPAINKNTIDKYLYDGSSRKVLMHPERYPHSTVSSFCLDKNENAT